MFWCYKKRSVSVKVCRSHGQFFLQAVSCQSLSHSVFSESAVATFLWPATSTIPSVPPGMAKDAPLWITPPQQPSASAITWPVLRFVIIDDKSIRYILFWLNLFFSFKVCIVDEGFFFFYAYFTWLSWLTPFFDIRYWLFNIFSFFLLINDLLTKLS